MKATTWIGLGLAAGALWYVTMRPRRQPVELLDVASDGAGPQVTSDVVQTRGTGHIPEPAQLVDSRRLYGTMVHIYHVQSPTHGSFYSLVPDPMRYGVMQVYRRGDPIPGNPPPGLSYGHVLAYITEAADAAEIADAFDSGLAAATLGDVEELFAMAAEEAPAISAPVVTVRRLQPTLIRRPLAPLTPTNRVVIG